MRKNETAPERLIALRDKLAITQAQMADLLGVSKNYIYLIESKTNKPGRKFIAKLEALEESESKKLDTPRFSVSENKNTVNETPEPYRVRREIWTEASNKKLEELLAEYSQEKDWGAVKEITTELLNRKITDKLKGKTP